MGLRTISTGVPSSKYGISSCGNIFATTPLFPCLPAILSPSEIFLVCAIHTLTCLLTPGGKSLTSLESRIFTSITLPL